MKKTLIITGGRIECDFALEFMYENTFDKIIVVDSGMEFAKKYELLPDIIVGDFDSVSDETLEYFRNKTEVIIREFDPIKDSTDTEIAIDMAIEYDSDEIYIIGATGSRLDHVFGNINILYRALRASKRAYIVDSCNRIHLEDKSFTIEREKAFGKYISFFALNGHVENLTLKGFKYPLSRYDLRYGSSLTVSNEISSDIAYVEYTSGVLICMESRD